MWVRVFRERFGVICFDFLRGFFGEDTALGSGTFREGIESFSFSFLYRFVLRAGSVF